MPKVSFPAAVRHLPESLLSLLRPGKIITAKVETLEGRLLTLFVGEERLEALLDEKVPPQLIKEGQTLRLKVISSGPPTVLSLMFPEAKDPLQEVPRLLQRVIWTALKERPLNQEAQPSPENLLVSFLKKLVLERPEKKPEISEGRSTREEKLFPSEEKRLSSEDLPRLSKERPTDQSKPLSDQTKAFEEKQIFSNRKEKEAISESNRSLPKERASFQREVQQKRIIHRSLEQARESLLKFWQEGLFLIPFVFPDQISWGYLHGREEKEGPSKKQLFVLRVFLSQGGYLEAYFDLVFPELNLELYFAREETLLLARKALPWLHESLSSLGFKPQITLEPLSSLPGVLLDAAG